VKNWEKTGLIKWEDKNGDGRMFYAKDDRNEMTIDRDIMVLANPEIAKLPAWVIALVAAGGLAAALSTAAGLLLVISSAISPRPAEEGGHAEHHRETGVAVRTHRGRRGGDHRRPAGHLPAGIRGAGGRLRVRPGGGIVLPGDLPRIFDKRANMPGAISGMIVGILFTGSYIIYFKFVNPTAGATSGCGRSRPRASASWACCSTSP